MNDAKIALVTGSSQGIGAGIARLLGVKGYTVVVTYKDNKDKADKVAQEINQREGKAG